MSMEPQNSESKGAIRKPNMAAIEVFERLDREKKGWLTKHQVKCALATLIGFKPFKVGYVF